MKTVTVRGLTLGEGRPKICVPIVGITDDEILASADACKSSAADLVEWRVDWYSSFDDTTCVLSLLLKLREILGELPLLFTCRTKKEGGEKEPSPEYYLKLNSAVAASGLVDLVDAELFSGDEIFTGIIKNAHTAGVPVIASSHDFKKTPEKDELIRRISRMQELGADILKLAVMPNDRADVMTLLSATEEMSRLYADRPIITMSMSRTGVISRIIGEFTGSALTFGAVGKTSAPGQIDAETLQGLLNGLHSVL